jgi:hypothetical protein
MPSTLAHLLAGQALDQQGRDLAFARRQLELQRAFGGQVLKGPDAGGVGL